MSIIVTMANGKSEIITIPREVFSQTSSLEECDIIDNWLSDNVKGAKGWSRYGC